jgi:hypothetical protein
MLRVSMVGDGFAEVDATVITIDGSALLCWGRSDEEPIARYGLEQVLSIRLVARPPANGERRADPAHPNAFRRWTVEQEEAIVDGYHRGESVEQIAAAVGRRVRGVRARLIALGVIEPEPSDRLSFPGVPALSALGRVGGGAGVDAGGAPGARSRPLLRAVERAESAQRPVPQTGGDGVGQDAPGWDAPERITQPVPPPG